MEVEWFKHRQLAPTVGQIVTIIGRIRRTFMININLLENRYAGRRELVTPFDGIIIATPDQHQDQSEDVKLDFYQEPVSAQNSVGLGLLLIKLATALVKIRSNL
jgi:hypothetical protein